MHKSEKCTLSKWTGGYWKFIAYYTDSISAWESLGQDTENSRVIRQHDLKIMIQHGGSK